MNNKKKKLIFLTGGGTGGSVIPLLAVTTELSGVDFLWLGTQAGLEKQIVEKEGIKFQAIINGKWRRYFSLKNFIDIFKIIGSFFQSVWLILIKKPDLIMSVGSFVSVPVVWAGWLLGVKILVHQQDARPGLANKLMAPFADIVTVTFEKSLDDYKKAVWTGNPTKIMNYPSRQPRRVQTGHRRADEDELPVSPASLSPGGSSASRGGGIQNGGKNVLPSALIVGGGTGAQAINDLVYKGLNELTKFCQIIHITGKGKNKNIKADNYCSYDFLDAKQIMEVLRKSNVVVSRCGMGLLTELSYLGKPAILIPMPNSHQEDNAKIFADKNAAIILNQKDLTPEKFIKEIKKILDDEVLRSMLRNNIKGVIKTDANKRIEKIINKLLS